MIILAVQGSGKSYAASQRDDTADVDRMRGREPLGDYIGRLLDADRSRRYTCGNLRLDIAEELDRRGVQFVMFAPFREFMREGEYREMKERIFGRLVLRREQSARTCGYLEDFKAGYDRFNSVHYYDSLSGKSLQYYTMGRDIDSVSALLELLDSQR